ncbi:penicillin-insensitive murein endopeptidase [Vibrio sp. McD22-P3]|nr:MULTISPECIES: penicillin-insensitive murein endopeptidase [Vibrio]MCF4174942.1 penicillin-insensitive murein endopeptidase [Vibrio sp. McD22-P3]
MMMKYGLLLSLLIPISSYALDRSWDEITVPSKGASSSIGSYANGCLAGGEELSLDGTGYQVIRAQRNRYYGHQDMIRYLTDLASKVDRLGMGQLLVGDIAMPRGGRFTSGHASHQTGLDADIWLRLPNEPLSKQELQDPEPYPVVDIDKYRFKKDKWTSNHSLLIQVAAVDDRVARIFVHPLIKKQLCEVSWKERDWLRKVRPWWGHYYHFHVRLHCPEGDEQCVAQNAPPPGDGCGAELASWKPYIPAKKATTKVKKSNKKTVSKPKYNECVALLTEP